MDSYLREEYDRKLSDAQQQVTEAYLEIGRLKEELAKALRAKDFYKNNCKAKFMGKVTIIELDKVVK
jgi:hypothetical protein